MERRTFFRTTMAAAVAASIPRRVHAGLPAWTAAQDPTDVIAVRGDGSKVTIRGAALKELRKNLRGRLLLPSNEGYDVARQVLNPSIDKRPAFIVQATGTADVRTAVAFARESSLLVAVKCGGHSFSGQSTCDQGMMIDLSPFRAVRVDPITRRAWVAGGTLLGQLDHEALSHGLVTTMGTVSHTGVGGLTTGGGFGRLARKHGLAIDNLLSVDVVTADGRFHHASKDENADLFWGVRGGGGNFGIVTSFEFRLHPMNRKVIGGDIVFPIARARDVLGFYADYTLAAPDDLYLDFVMVHPPGGAPGNILLHTCYSGPENTASRVLDPIRKLGNPVADQIRAIDYAELQRSGDVSDPRAMGTYLKSGFTKAITPDLIKAIIGGFEPHPARATLIFSQHCGGAIGRVPTEEMAFAHRDAQHNLLTAVAWKTGDDSAPHMKRARDYWSTLEPFTSGWYVNEVADESAGVINANYRQNYKRLVAVKATYDPTNLFRLNANVKPG